MASFPSVLVGLFLASAGVAVAASLTERRGLLAIFKPLTTALLFVVVGVPRGRFGWLIDLGLLFSLAGDTALLFRSKNALLIGLAIFLGAHVSYIVAFAGVATFSTPALITAVVMAGASALLLRRLWAGASGMRAPLVVYAAALSTMVTAAVAAVSTPPPIGVTMTAAVGALFFYVGDASLAIDQFDRRFKLAPLLTLGVYWLGQLGIALAARASNG
jgi:uncharacterized membrane protein YhhN